VKRLHGVVASAALLALLAGCGSAPKEQFYTLADPAPKTTGSLSGLEYGVAIGPVYVPDSVDRPQFVLRTPGAEVRIAEQVRWAEPLKEGIARAVATTPSTTQVRGLPSVPAQAPPAAAAQAPAAPTQVAPGVAPPPVTQPGPAAPRRDSPPDPRRPLSASGRRRMARRDTGRLVTAPSRPA